MKKLLEQLKITTTTLENYLFERYSKLLSSSTKIQKKQIHINEQKHLLYEILIFIYLKVLSKNFLQNYF